MTPNTELEPLPTTPSELARNAQKEESLVALYMELTGASENLARNVYAHLEVVKDLDHGSSCAWNGSIEPSIRMANAAGEARNHFGIRHVFQNRSGLFGPREEPALSGAGGG